MSVDTTEVAQAVIVPVHVECRPKDVHIPTTRSHPFQVSGMPAEGDKVLLHLSCSGLPALDFASLSDPFVVVSVQENDSWAQLGLPAASRNPFPSYVLNA